MDHTSSESCGSSRANSSPLVRSSTKAIATRTTELNNCQAPTVSSKRHTRPRISRQLNRNASRQPQFSSVHAGIVKAQRAKIPMAHMA